MNKFCILLVVRLIETSLVERCHRLIFDFLFIFEFFAIKIHSFQVNDDYQLINFNT